MSSLGTDSEANGSPRWAEFLNPLLTTDVYTPLVAEQKRAAVDMLPDVGVSRTSAA